MLAILLFTTFFFNNILQNNDLFINKCVPLHCVKVGTIKGTSKKKSPVQVVETKQQQQQKKIGMAFSSFSRSSAAEHLGCFSRPPDPKNVHKNKAHKSLYVKWTNIYGKNNGFLRGFCIRCGFFFCCPAGVSTKLKLGANLN